MSEQAWQWRVLRWTVPVDDRPHEIGGGKVLMTACRQTGRVEVWTDEYVCDQTFDVTFPKRTVQAHGTGQPLTDQQARTHVGSALDGPFVWHVFTTTTEETAP